MNAFNLGKKKLVTQRYLCISSQDVKCSGNWMWAAKLPGEGACLWEACLAMCEVMGQLGVAVDGGKDSLSMAARVSGETVKAPGICLVHVRTRDISSYFVVESSNTKKEKVISHKLKCK